MHFDKFVTGSTSRVSFGRRTRAALMAGVIATLGITATAAAAEAAEAEAGAEAAAQISDAQGDIVVTAERRSTSLQKTPLSVGVVGADQLQGQNVAMLRDLAGSVASLQSPPMFSPTMSYLFIRGIGTSSPTYNGAVGVYIDDVYQARVINSGAFNLPDVEQVEVLRGPQGTLYGQNTSGGAIKLITRKPGDETRGSFSAAIGDYGQFEASGYLSGPIVPGVLAASLAYSHSETGGYTYNATLDKKVNAIRTDQGRFKLRFTPDGSDFEADLSVYFLRDRSDNNSYTPLNVPNPDPRVTFENLDLEIHNNAFLVSLNLTKPLTDTLTLKSISGWRGFENDPQPWSLDGLASSLFSWDLNIRQRQYSQEFQLLGDFGPLSVTGGAIVFHETFRSNRPSVTLGNYAGSRSDTTSTNVGVYTQAHYAFSDKLGATLGLRYYKQWDKYDNVGYVSNAAYEELGQRYALNGLKQNTDGLTPKIGIDYRFTNRLFGYASVTKGQKSGGYNPVASAAAIASVPVDPEEVTAYEAGLKFNTPGNGLILNVAGFYNDFKDYQTALSNVYLNGVLINGSVTVNAAKSRTYGVEAEATLRPIDGLEFRLSGTALDASFRDFSYALASGSVNYDGNQLPYVAKYSTTGSIAYRFAVGSLGELRTRAEAKYQSRSYTDIQNNIVVPKQTYVNLDAQFVTADERWTIFGLVKNLFDKTYPTAGIPISPPIPGVLTTFYNPPRMFQIGARYSF